MLRSFRSYLPYLLLAVVSALLIGASVRYQASKKCAGVQVQFEPNNAGGLVSQEDVLNLLDAALLRGMPVNKIALAELELKLEQHPYLAKADLYLPDGEQLHARLVVRQPIARVMPQGETGYYLDSAGYALPLVPGRSLRCPVVTGAVPSLRSALRKKVEDERLLNLVPLLVEAQADSFWHAQLAQVHLQEQGQAELSLQAGDFVVEFGAPVEARRKFQVLEQFFRKVLTRTGWDAYSRLKLAYDGQVVATRSSRYPTAHS